MDDDDLKWQATFVVGFLILFVVLVVIGISKTFKKVDYSEIETTSVIKNDSKN